MQQTWVVRWFHPHSCYSRLGELVLLLKSELANWTRFSTIADLTELLLLLVVNRLLDLGSALDKRDRLEETSVRYVILEPASSCDRHICRSYACMFSWCCCSSWYEAVSLLVVGRTSLRRSWCSRTRLSIVKRAEDRFERWRIRGGRHVGGTLIARRWPFEG